MNVLVTGGGGFLGSRLVERLRKEGHEPFVARRHDYDLTIADEVERLFADARPELVAELTGYQGEIVWDTSKPNGQPRRQLDVSRAERLFGFRAATGLREGIERTVAWYRADAPSYAAR